MVPLVSTQWLADKIHLPEIVIVDVRWEHGHPESGRNAYLKGHLPGALYLDLDDELSNRSDLSKGRHPLPDPDKFIHLLTRNGIGQNTQLVVYDDKAGSLGTRLWWMMHWIGTPIASILDGGFEKWVKDGFPVEVGAGRTPVKTSNPIPLQLRPNLAASMSEVEHVLENGAILLDARAASRYRGENETIDVRAGHIPNAISAPWTDNLNGLHDPTFKKPEVLKEQYEQLGVKPDSKVICYCGSGVTSCHNVFALGLAGFKNVKLYPGSWSEWVANHQI